VLIRRAQARRPNDLPDVRAGGIRPCAEPVSRCRGASEEPFGATTGPRAPGPLHWTISSSWNRSVEGDSEMTGIEAAPPG